jgi:penicillin amidase
MRKLRIAVVLVGVLVASAAAYARWLTRRALPVLDGEVRVPGLARPVDVVRDRWGVPHIFAVEDDDAYFGLGYVHAQDRLFQLQLTRHASQGRLAELFGERALNLDRLFRTMDFHGGAKRMLAQARPEIRSGVEAYTRGVNAGVAALRGRLPPEFTLLKIGFEPAQPDDFLGQLGLMIWNLHYSWVFDPLYERVVAKVGPERARELFPDAMGGEPAVHPGRGATPLTLGFRLTPEEWALLDTLPSLRASNNWVVGPAKSATGRALLANDPHLGHGLPGVWYEAHVKSRTQDVIGVTLPGLPLVVLGHNRDIGWGFTNAMQDAGDFFLERLDPERPGEVMERGGWTKLHVRRETLGVRDGKDVELVVRFTSHGPLVNELLPDLKEPVAYRWIFHAAEQANEIEGFWALNRARNWDEFRAALRRFGGVAQNAVYADRQGHIGMQLTGAYPRLSGTRDGLRFRRGWDGSEEWDGLRPFEENPSTFDPEQGWLASANNPILPAPMPFYVSGQWEPKDRIRRIHELLREKQRLGVEDMKRLHADTVQISARELAPLIQAAFASQPAGDERVRAALATLEAWNGDMKSELQAPALFAVFYRRLFYELFEDELGTELAKGYRSRANVSATMMHAVIENAALWRWFDRADTQGVEDRDAILRSAFEKAVRELREQLGGEPKSWSWGRLHTLELQHPVGRASRLLRPYFNRGPFAVPGSSATVNKMEYEEADFRVLHGASMRQITDFADLNASLAVLPAGQSGIPASPHYDDQLPLWLAGAYHPRPIDAAAIDKVAAHRLRLLPAQ